MPKYSVSQWRYRRRGIVILGLALLLVIIFATAFGSVRIPFLDGIRIVAGKLPFFNPEASWPDAYETIIFNIRLPRALLAGLVGAALAAAGATYQGLFRNPLADPYLIGVSQGAALGAVIGILLPAATLSLGQWVTPVMAFSGALIATVAVYSLARIGKMVPVTTLILAGVALGALLSSIVSYLIISSGDKVHEIVFWLMGSLSMSRWEEVRIVFPYILVGLGVLIIYARPLNIMQLDEEQARQLGVNVERLKIILLGAATLITAAAVSFVGTIGFVGIIVPHAVRLVWGPDHRFLLPLSMLSGAVFLILADLVARMVLAPTELPIGVITAICGAPFFLYLLRRRKSVIF
ncbi:FecCD family ABC transporter permease [Chloroflexota bacterium]